MSSITPNRGYIQPTVGGNLNVWGGLLNGDLGTVDLNLGGVQSISVAGNSNVTLTATQGQNLATNLTGALTGAINVIWPPGGGFYLIKNSTTGAFALTLITSAVSPTGVVAPQDGKTYLYYTDGTTFYNLSANATQLQGIAVKSGTPSDGQLLTYVAANSDLEYKSLQTFPMGTLLAFPQASAPTGWTQVNTFNDQVLRFVNNTGTGGATGGTWTISGNFGSTDGHALGAGEQANMPVTGSTGATLSSNPSGGTVGGLTSTGPQNVYNEGTTITGTATGGGITGALHAHPLTSISSDGVWRPAFANAIVCQKN